ncbi:MAG: sigma-54-dependent Fis family transcriptional regulator [Melioribacteraceae bacterium]|nr:sigma-54-dependent Fis family transcriptional regulator [Melioribacteraceae bacterium]
MDKLVFIVDDEPSILKLISFWVKEKWNYKIKTFSNGNDFFNALDENPDLVLLDIMLPDISGIDILKRLKQERPLLPVIMLSAQGSVEVAIDSIKMGAFDYFPKPIDVNHLEPAVKNAIRNYDLEREVEDLKSEVKKEFSFDNIISTNDRMQDVFKLISKVLSNDITVLVHGESGTGKELVARAIHYNGSRKDNSFVVVNCASIPRELLESELFGHERGAFTGAHQRKIGKFEVANGGTLFLDEIGEMEMSLQAKILRVIQQKEFERVGGNETIKTDVRIISATNRNLEEMVAQREFREDLYYRLNSFPIIVPPLRERKSDILVLIDYFVEKFNTKLGKNIKGVSKKALRVLFDYEWPGNVRELENMLERCIILADGDKIDISELPQHILGSDGLKNFSFDDGVMFSDDTPVIPFEKLKEEAIKHALRITNNNIVEAAKKLQIGRATLYRLMEKYGIENK